MKTITDAMQWRYATQKFDTNKKLTAEQVEGLLQSIILSPSCYGLQMWKVIVVENEAVRAKLREAGYGQAKISEASHLFVFAARTDIDDVLVDTFIKFVSDTRGVPVEKLKGYEDMIKGTISHMNAKERIVWATKQAYIALGVLIAGAAVEGIDVGPMEGFDTKKFDEILGLEKMNLESKVIAAVGYRATDDASATLKKVRFPKEETVIQVK